MSDPASIGALGEFPLIARIVGRLGPSRADTVVGAGLDDAAVLRLPGGGLQLVTIDGQVEGSHFRRDGASAVDLGRRAAAVNLSDIAAMGGSPTHAVAALAAPADLPTEWALQLVDGLAGELRRWGAELVGGNMARGPVVVFDIALLGTVDEDRLLLRSGARPGDALLVTGDLGASAAGLAVLEAERARGREADDGPGDSGRSRSHGAAPAASGARTAALGALNAVERDAVVARHRTPTPRLDVAPLLRPLGATGGLDVSDGLAGDAAHLCERSGVGVRIEAAAIPIAAATRAAAASLGASPLAWAVGGGEDYELLLAADPARADDLARAVTEATGVPVTRIGTVTEDLGRVLLLPDGAEVPLAGGWRHFGG